MGAEEAPDLVADGPEDLVGLRTARDQRRHAPQRRLLVGELCKRLPGLRIRDRRCNQLREPLEPLLGVAR